MSTYKTLNDLDLELMPRRQRGSLVNALSGFKSVNLVGTSNDAGVHNLSIVAPWSTWAPIRPARHGDASSGGPGARQPHLLEHPETGCYTINHVPTTHTVQAHQVSALSEEESEFDAVGFTPIYRCGFDAPAVEESPVRIGLERVDEWEIAQNRCRFIVGQIRWVEFPEEAWATDGYLDIESSVSLR